MPAFHYVAVNSLGKEQKGVLEADNDKQVRQLLRDKSLIPLKVQTTNQKTKNDNSSSTLFAWRKSLSIKELALMTRQFATLLTAGLPIEEALNAAAEQNEKSVAKSIILSVRSKVLEGHSLAAGLSEHPRTFSNLYIATVAAGEKSGHLDKVLMRLADYTEQQWQLQQKLRTAMIYPSMIVLVAVGIVGFLLEYVVPKMVGVYGSLNQELPTLTQTLIAISTGLQSYGFYGVVAIVASVFFWRRALAKSQRLTENYHRFILRLPMLGSAIKTTNTARFSRTLAILSSSGVPVLEAMTIASQLMTSLPIRHAVKTAVLRVSEGTSIHVALKQCGYFSPMSIHMIASGEASGKLEELLDRVAANQESDIIRLIDVGLALFEPAVILLMGVIVLFIVLAVLLPIFNLNQFAG